MKNLILTPDSLLFFMAYGLLAALSLLQIMDVCGTYVRIHAGTAREGNPVVAWCITQCGLGWGLALAKLPVVAAIAYAAWSVAQASQPPSLAFYAALICVTAVYAWVVWSNRRLQ